MKCNRQLHHAQVGTDMPADCTVTFKYQLPHFLSQFLELIQVHRFDVLGLVDFIQQEIRMLIHFFHLSNLQTIFLAIYFTTLHEIKKTVDNSFNLTATKKIRNIK